MLCRFLKNQQVTKSALRLVQPVALTCVQSRQFGHTKYSFDDEDWKPNQFQVSIRLSAQCFNGLRV